MLALVGGHYCTIVLDDGTSWAMVGTRWSQPSDHNSSAHPPSASATQPTTIIIIIITIYIISTIIITIYLIRIIIITLFANELDWSASCNKEGPEK